MSFNGRGCSSRKQKRLNLQAIQGGASATPTDAQGAFL